MILHDLFRLISGAGAGLAFAVMPALSVAQKSTPDAVKNIVLVHGAFADGTSWSKIIPTVLS